MKFCLLLRRVSCFTSLEGERFVCAGTRRLAEQMIFLKIQKFAVIFQAIFHVDESLLSSSSIK